MDTAVLVIDVQNSVVDEGIWDAEGVMDRLNQLAEAGRGAGAPVIWVRDLTVEPDGALHPSMVQKPGDLHLEKRHNDGFVDTNLQALLQDKQVKRLIVGGMQSDYCVQATCRGAVALGYEVLLVKDAHSTIDWDGETAQQIAARIDATLSGMTGAPGRVRVLDTAAALHHLQSHRE